MAEVKTERRQALDLAISQIERQFGKGSVMRLGAGGPLEEIAVMGISAVIARLRWASRYRSRCAQSATCR